MTPDEYKKANPLGGPAKMFDTIADRIRAGEDMAAVMDDYGICFKPAEQKQESRRHAYRPDPKYPWFCKDCGYAEHEKLKHL